ncbi:hypothetical protein WDH52_22920 [Streptomyces sp. TRM70308]|uniref:hypothetical protein n=1 Tax=Streptomyces sp. TRM70308 TaxID=3131932 RepID=UPI003CFBC799
MGHLSDLGPKRAEAYGLLVAGEGAHRGAAALAGLPAAALLGTEAGGRVVQLTAPLEPEQVRAALRTAAGHRGPLLVGVAGRLMLDRWCGEPYVAIGAAARSVRYDGLPWLWLNTHLWPRPAGSTTVVVDLAAGQDAAAALENDSGLLDVEGAAVMGVVCGPRRAAAVGGYSAALAAVLRAGGGPVPATHDRAVARAGLAHRAGVRVLCRRTPPPVAPMAQARVPPRPVVPPMPTAPPTAPSRAVSGVPVPEGGVHYAIYAEAQAGRHSAAMALAAGQELAALRSHGARSEEAVHWLEVRADLARLAGTWAEAARGWLDATRARLTMGASPDAPAVREAVDRAHHCWHRATEEPESYLELGQALAEIRARVPGPAGARADIRARLAAAPIGVTGR